MRTGAAIYGSPGTPVYVTHSTIVNNAAAPGLAALDFSTGTISNSILAGNTPKPVAIAPWGGLYNLESPGTSCDNGSTGSVNADPLLGSRGTYGGTTPLYPLLPGSPAINAADCTFSSTPDHRSAGRRASSPAGCSDGHRCVRGPRCSPSDAELDIADTTPDGLCDAGGGQCSLREAISEANARPGHDAVDLPAGTYTLTLHGSGEYANATGDLNITDNFTMRGAGASTTVIEWPAADAGADHVISVDGLSGINSALSGVTIRNGRATWGAGLAMSCANTAIFDTSIEGNTATNSGGGLGAGAEACSTTVDIRNSSIISNRAGIDGGGIHLIGANLTLTESSVQENATGGARRNLLGPRVPPSPNQRHPRQ